MENIQVIVRVRPSNPMEREGNDLEIWQIVGGDTITISADRYNDLVRMRKFLPSQRVEFSFSNNQSIKQDQCYDQKLNTHSIYNQQIRRITLSALQGINGTIFMYGQTGSGKTFTMMGPHGIEQSTVHHQKQNSGIASNTPKNLLKELPSSSSNPLRNQTSNTQRTNPRNNSHRSPSNRTKDRTPQRQESVGNNVVSQDAETPDKLNLQLKKNSIPFREDFKSLQFESEYDGKNQEGLLILALQDMFMEIEKSHDKQFLLRCSYVEIYTDQVYDLLKPQERLNEILSINEDTQREFYIKGATEEIVSSIDEILEMIKRGETNRHYASTIMNHASSRSHTIFRLVQNYLEVNQYVRCVPNQLDTNSYITESILNFVDLAGSEKINIHDSIMKKRGQSVSNGGVSLGQSQTTFKDRTNESKHINKSLFYLTQVISLRSQGQKDQHIPYRNSPLTKILRSSLGGNSRTAIIICVNPCFSQFEQTLSTLRFGSNAKQIRNNVQKNIVSCDNEEAITKIIGDYERKISEMEKFHINKNESLQKIIEILQGRSCNLKDKQLIEGAESRTQQFMEQSDKPKTWSHIHYPGVGILQVPANSEISHQSPRSCDKSFQDTINKREYNLNEQIKLNELKVFTLNQQLEESNQRRAELLAQSQKLEKKYSRSKKDLEQQFQINLTLSSDNKRLMKICALHHSQLEINDLLQLDAQSLEIINQNLSNMAENLLKMKIYKELQNKSSEPSIIESLKIKSNPEMTIKYPKSFFDQDVDSLLFWDEEPKMLQKQLNSFDDTESIIVSTHLGTVKSIDTGFLSFQNYFQQGSNDRYKIESDVDNINHKLTMLRSDYNLLKMSPVRKDYEYRQIYNPQNEVQMSNQSIQNFKEPTAHQNKITSPQIPPLVLNNQNHNAPALSNLQGNSSPQLKDRYRQQIDELTQIQQQNQRGKIGISQAVGIQGGKENATNYQPFDFSKKTNSVPVIENEYNFSSYFDSRNYGK